MMKIYAKYSAEVQDYGDQDEKDYETDETNEENMNEFFLFICSLKIGKYKTYY